MNLNFFGQETLKANVGWFIREIETDDFIGLVISKSHFCSQKSDFSEVLRESERRNKGINLTTGSLFLSFVFKMTKNSNLE